MRLRSSLPVVSIGLILSTPVFAQNTPNGVVPAPPRPIGDRGQAPRPAGPQMLVVTQTSRVRAFNAGPDGEVRSLYLQNGSVVDISPELGRQLSTQAHKGARITVTGSRSIVDGQRILMAKQVTMNSQTYSAQLRGGPDGGLNGAPDAGPRVGPDDGRGTISPPPPTPDARVNGSGGPLGPQPGRGPGAPPPPPGGTVARNADGPRIPPPPPGQAAPADQRGTVNPSPAQTPDPNTTARIPQPPPSR